MVILFLAIAYSVITTQGVNLAGFARRVFGIDGAPRPVESHEEAEDPDKQDEGVEDS